jgi:cytochrome c oxidase subunit IV
MAHDAAAPHEHAHPGAGTYVKIAVILFVLTALEVGGYEVVHRGEPAGLAAMLGPIFVEVLLLLSALKFALVAMFYMHPRWTRSSSARSSSSRSSSPRW